MIVYFPLSKEQFGAGPIGVAQDCGDTVGVGCLSTGALGAEK